MSLVASVEDIIKDMQRGSEIHFSDLAKVCQHFFGSPTSKGTSHQVYKTPWPGDPRVNIQNEKGRAKRYQVRQVLAAIAKKQQLDAEQAAAKADALQKGGHARDVSEKKSKKK